MDTNQPDDDTPFLPGVAWDPTSRHDPAPGPEHRYLKPGELVEEGDEHWCEHDSAWKPARSVGRLYNAAWPIFRRATV